MIAAEIVAEVGTRIAEARRELGLSQTSAAERIGCAQSALAMWETGSRIPSLENFLAICRGLGVRPDRLLGLDGP